MRIQTRLFLGTAALVLAVMGLQWWLYARQLRSIEEDLTNVAASVGKDVLVGGIRPFRWHHMDGRTTCGCDRPTTVRSIRFRDPPKGEAEKERPGRRGTRGPPRITGMSAKWTRHVHQQIEDDGDGVLEEKIEWIIETQGDEEGSRGGGRVPGATRSRPLPMGRSRRANWSSRSKMAKSATIGSLS